MNNPLQLHPKTAAAGLSGSAGLVLLWILSLFHVAVSPEVAGALVVVLAAAGSWLAPLVKGEPAVASGDPPVPAS